MAESRGGASPGTESAGLDHFHRFDTGLVPGLVAPLAQRDDPNALGIGTPHKGTIAASTWFTKFQVQFQVIFLWKNPPSAAKPGGADTPASEIAFVSSPAPVSSKLLTVCEQVLLAREGANAQF